MPASTRKRALGSVLGACLQSPIFRCCRCAACLNCLMQWVTTGRFPVRLASSSVRQKGDHDRHVGASGDRLAYGKTADQALALACKPVRLCACARPGREQRCREAVVVAEAGQSTNRVQGHVAGYRPPGLVLRDDAAVAGWQARDAGRRKMPSYSSRGAAKNAGLTRNWPITQNGSPTVWTAAASGSPSARATGRSGSSPASPRYAAAPCRFCSTPSLPSPPCSTCCRTAAHGGSSRLLPRSIGCAGRAKRPLSRSWSSTSRTVPVRVSARGEVCWRMREASFLRLGTRMKLFCSTRPARPDPPKEYPSVTAISPSRSACAAASSRGSPGEAGPAPDEDAEPEQTREEGLGEPALLLDPRLQSRDESFIEPRYADQEGRPPPLAGPLEPAGR